MAQQQATKIVVVAPAEGKPGDLVSQLQAQGYQVVGCADTGKLAEAFAHGPADLVIGMVSPDPAKAKEFVQQCRIASNDIPVMLLVDGQELLAVTEAVRPEALVVHAGSFEGAASRWLTQAAVAYRGLGRENQRLSEAVQQASKALASEVSTRKFAEEALQTSLRRLELAYTQANYYTGELRKEILTRKRAEEALVRSEELLRLQAA